MEISRVLMKGRTLQGVWLFPEKLIAVKADSFRAHQLGGYYDLPHGVCNAILLPHVQAYNAKAVPERFVDIAQAMGVETRDMGSSEAAEAALKAIRNLSAEVGIPPNLAAFEVIKPDDFAALSDNAKLDACGATNPHQPTKDEVVALYSAANQGHAERVE